MFVGEAPGRSEVAKGEPFYSPAGDLLNRSIMLAGIDPDDCMFVNVVWCPPRAIPDGEISPPTLDEADACLEHIYASIKYYKPKVLVTVGSVALQSFIRRNVPVTKQHGTLFKIEGAPVTVQYADWLEWREQHKNVLHLKTSLSYEDVYAPVYDPHLDPEACRWQVSIAEQDLGYTPSWSDVLVMPVIHPSYALRQQQQKWEESITLDLKALKTQLEGVEKQYNYRLINTVEDLEAYTEEVISQYQNGEFGFLGADIETSEACKGDVWRLPFLPETEIWTIQFSRWDYEGVMIMVTHKSSNFQDPHTFRILRGCLYRILTTIPIVGHNWYGFDSLVLKTKLSIEGIKLVGDTMLMDHWLNMGKGLSSGLDVVGMRYLGTSGHKRDAINWRQQHPTKTFQDMPLDMGLGYACGDTDVTRRAYLKMRKLIEAEGRWDDYFEIHHGQHNTCQLITDMVWGGMPVHKEQLDYLKEYYPRVIDECMEEIHKNPFVQTWTGRRMQAYNEEALHYNASIQPGSRKQPRPIFGLPDWLAVTDRKGKRKNYWNPGSWQQILDLWGMMEIPYHYMPDLEWSDRNKTRPKTNAHNREVILKMIAQWTRQWQHGLTDAYKEGDQAKIDSLTASIVVWARVGQVIELQGVYKDLTKTYGTYVMGIYSVMPYAPGYSHPEDSTYQNTVRDLYRPYANHPVPWSVHSSYHLNGTETGRISSSNPNGQNYPSHKTNKEADVKSVYVSRNYRKGGLVVSADYSQIEVRVAVMYAKDEGLAAAINAGKDVHTYVTSQVYAIPEEEVTKEKRTPTKRITFGMLYGQGVGALAAALGISNDEAQALTDQFFDQMPSFKGFIDGQHELVLEVGYVTTKTGRRRYIAAVHSDNEVDVAKALRQAVNTPIQGTASDMGTMAMARVWQQARPTLDCWPYNIIHDSQGFDIMATQLMDLMELMYYEMVWKSYQLWDWVNCKPEAEFDIGAGWGNLIEAKLLFDDQNVNYDHHRLDLRGDPEKIDLIFDEFNACGQTFEVESDKAHPNAEEASKGKVQRVLRIDRQKPIYWVQDKQLQVNTYA
jgi:uracil-DNA glycosylase family 4